MPRYDAVIVGSGINSLAAGALLAKAGWSVCILERNDWLGGAIKTAEITRPGFVHEVFAAWHPLFVGCLCVAFQIPPLVLLAIPASAAAIAAAAFCEGVGIELFSVYWDTSLQRHVPGEALSRVASYDALGSWVLLPIAFAVVGPIASLVGTRATLLGAAGVVALAVLAMAATADSRRLEAGPVAAPTPETDLPAARPGSIS